MGYIPLNSAYTFCQGSLDIHWTELGRKYLIGLKKPKNGSLIHFFSLSDTDKNYFSVVEPAPNFVPDITGDHTLCLIPTYSTRVRNELTVEDLNTSNTIDYRTKALRGCTPTTIIDCSKYYDMYPLLSSDTRSTELLINSIWSCIIGNFDGSLV
jgi:hypothetical protein